MSAAGGNLNSTVAITISVVDANSAATVQKVQQQIVGLGQAAHMSSDEAKAMVSALANMSANLEVLAQKGGMARAGVRGVGEESLNSLQSVRLFRQELGLNIPRAMESVISKSQLLMTGIKAITGGLIALGFINIFEQIGKDAYNFYQQNLSINHAIDDYTKKAKEAAQQKLFDTASLEVTSALLGQINLQIDAYNQMRQATPGLADWINNPQGALVQQLMANDASKRQATAMGQRDQLQDRQMKQIESRVEAEDKMNQDYVSSVTQGYAQISAKEAGLKQQIEDRYAFQKANEADLARRAGVSVDVYNQGISRQRDDELRQAGLQAAAERVNLKRQETEQVIQLQNQAVLAGLDGENKLVEATYQAQSKIVREYEQGKVSYIGMIAEIAAEQQKFDGETAQLHREQLAERQREEAEQEHEAEQFYGRLNQIGANYDSQSMQGYAKIEADFKQKVGQMASAYENFVSGMANADPRRFTAAAALGDALTRATQNADRERADYTTKTNEQITQEEAKAARLLLPQWQQAQQAIIDTYDQRLRKIQQDLRTGTVNEQQAAGEAQAAWMEANAAMEKSLEQERDTLASRMRELFTDPGKFIEKQAEDLMMKILANWVMQLTNFNGSSGASGIVRWLFGMGGDVPTNNSQLGRVFGGGGLGSSPLSSAGTTLTTAGTSLNTAAVNLNAAAQSLQFAGTSSMGGGSLFGAFSGGSGGGIPSPFSGIPNLDISGGLSAQLPALGASSDAIPATGTSGIGTAWSQESSTASASASSLDNGAGFSLGGAVAAGTGLIGTIMAARSGNALGSLVSGGMTGASIGMMAGGPLGAAIGAGLGAVVGGIASIFGDHGEAKARQYEMQNVLPTMAENSQGYESGQTGYDQAEKRLNDLFNQAYWDTKSMGSGAQKYFTSQIQPHIYAMQADLLRQEMGGRGNIKFSAAQFHDGGPVNGFGSLWTSSTEGLAKLMIGEHVMNPAASSRYSATLEAMNRGVDVSGIINSYVRGNRVAPAASGGGGSITIQALDSQSFDYALRNGGARTIRKHLNTDTGRYSGLSDGVS